MNLITSVCYCPQVAAMAAAISILCYLCKRDLDTMVNITSTCSGFSLLSPFFFFAQFFCKSYFCCQQNEHVVVTFTLHSDRYTKIMVHSEQNTLCKWARLFPSHPNTKEGKSLAAWD